MLRSRRRAVLGILVPALASLAALWLQSPRAAEPLERRGPVGCAAAALSGDGHVRRVPADYGTIQAAIGAAQNGDTVIVSPGTYTGGLSISGKTIILASRYIESGDVSDIDSTVIQSGAPIIAVRAGAAGSRIVGFTLRGGRKGIQLFTNAEASCNKLLHVGSDALSLERTGGVLRGNVIDSPGDDCIDADGPGESVVEDNVCTDAHDDGIEIRNYAYEASPVTLRVRRNRIVGAGEDGIQIIDYPPVSRRSFVIERNIIVASEDAGLGIMDGGQSREDFRAASMPERVDVFNNTLVKNSHGISGGDDLVAVNNLIVGCRVVGVKGVDGSSTVAHNLFWSNARDWSASNVEESTTTLKDPLLTSAYELQARSPAIDAGVPSFSHDGQTVLSLAAGDFSGSAPDLGAVERGSGAPTPSCRAGP